MTYFAALIAVIFAANSAEPDEHDPRFAPCQAWFEANQLNRHSMIHANTEEERNQQINACMGKDNG